MGTLTYGFQKLQTPNLIHRQDPKKTLTRRSGFVSWLGISNLPWSFNPVPWRRPEKETFEKYRLSGHYQKNTLLKID